VIASRAPFVRVSTAARPALRPRYGGRSPLGALSVQILRVHLGLRAGFHPGVVPMRLATPQARTLFAAEGGVCGHV
jgi:hypothetical protein